MVRIVYLGPEHGLDAVRQVAGDLAQVDPARAETVALARALEGADALIDASMRVRIDRELLAAASSLRVIATATTGSDHIDLAAARNCGIAVLTLKDDRAVLRNVTAAAEHSWALVLACARRLVPAVMHVREGGWSREDYPGLMLHGRTLGLVGCGRIGMWMARYGAAFGMNVVGCDPGLETWPEGVVRADLEGVLGAADIVSVHVHLDAQTRGLIGARQFAQMKPGAIFVNTSRGAVSDEAALLAALESGHLGAAGLDVLDGEPDIGGHPLLAYARRHDNLLITPHCGGFSPDAVRLVCAHTAAKVMAHLAGER